MMNWAVMFFIVAIIAAVLGVTESRICQLHSQSIARLRSKLREH